LKQNPRVKVIWDCSEGERGRIIQRDRSEGRLRSERSERSEREE
jgi:hypothetical protein